MILKNKIKTIFHFSCLKETLCSLSVDHRGLGSPTSAEVIPLQLPMKSAPPFMKNTTKNAITNSTTDFTDTITTVNLLSQNL